jgi:hypothetical protein
MDELLERDSETGPEELDSDPGPPVAHIAPVGPDGVRRTLCGQPVLGIPVGNSEYVLCEGCDHLSKFDHHPDWDGKF